MLVDDYLEKAYALQHVVRFLLVDMALCLLHTHVRKRLCGHKCVVPVGITHVRGRIRLMSLTSFFGEFCDIYTVRLSGCYLTQICTETSAALYILYT